MLWETVSAARDLGRLHEIASVLIRWGYGDLVRRMGLSHALERAGRVLHFGDTTHLYELEPPERVCSALQELGPTFIKLGQMLATRVDLFPAEWVEAFETLQDEVPAVPVEELQEAIEEVFGTDPSVVLLKLEDKAFAAASIAQVHKAQLVTGERVVVKFRRPGIEKKVDADLRLLNRLAEIVEHNIAELKRFQPTEVVRQFSQSLRRELDLAAESRNADRIAGIFEGDENIVIPKLYWQWTSERVNTQEYISGIRGRALIAREHKGFDRKILARKGGAAVLRMVLVEGFFHADPHLGNLIALPQNRIAFIDFGMVGRLTSTRRDEITQLLFGLVQKQPEKVVEILRVWIEDKNPHLDEEALVTDVDRFLDQYHGLTVGQLNLTTMINDLVAILRDHELILPPDLALLFKTFLTLDGVGRRIDPEFNIVEEAAPLISDIMAKRYSPAMVAKRSLENAKASLMVLNQLPKDVQSLVRSAQRGNLEVKMELNRLDRFGHLLDRAVSRLTIGIVVAALIIGTAVVSATDKQPEVFGVPAWGFVGFIVAALGGVWLLVSIWRGNRD